MLIMSIMLTMLTMLIIIAIMDVNCKVAKDVESSNRINI